MTADEARDEAHRVRPVHEISPDAHIVSADLYYIELPQQAAEVPSPVRDVLAWLVRFQRRTGWVELAIDDSTRDVVRVERSR